MAITKAAQKALRQSTRRRKINLTYRKKIKEITKKIRSLVLENRNQEAKTLLPQLYKVLDKAAKKGVIKKNTVSRKKSRVTKLVLKSHSPTSQAPVLAQ